MRILIPHSWSKNVGDMALLQTTVRTLREIAPEAEVTALVSNPAFTRSRLPDADVALEGWPWPLGRRSASSMVTYPLILASHFLSVVLFRAAKMRVFLFNRRFSRQLSAFLDCDVVVSPGGDFINPKYSFITTLSEFIFAKILGKRLVILAQTIGPFQGFLNGRIAAAILNSADLVIVREEKTAELLRRIGVKDFHVTADIVFAYPPPERHVGKRGRLIICAERFLDDRKTEAYKRFLMDLAARIKEEFGFDIVYMPANSMDIGLHLELAGGECEAIGEVKPPSEVSSILSRADFLVSSRMHPIILGALSGTPFFSIGDSFKFREVLGPLCADCTMTVSDARGEESIERILSRIRDREGLRETISRNYPSLRSRSLENRRLLTESFERWGFLGGARSRG